MIFLTRLYEQKQEKNIIQKSKISLVNADYIFQKNIIDGLLANDQIFSIISVLPVGSFPNQYADFCLKSKTWNYKNIPCQEIGSLNIPIFKQAQRARKIRAAIKKSGDKNILVYAAYTPFLKAISKLDASYKITLIVTDLPEYYFLQKTNLIEKIHKAHTTKQNKKYLRRIDKFILLTDAMAQKLNIGKKPYIVMEGICKESSKMPQKSKNDKKIIFYSGSLREKDGIKNLIDAFSQTREKNYILQICGKGEMENYIREAAKKDKRINYLGYLSHEKILELEQNATLLINPRQNNGEYTKYSFPSKTMEYLASGTSVLMYKLDGIPKEYDNYLHYVNGNSVENLKNAMERILEKPENELGVFGKKAREWVLTNKNETIQAKRIIQLIYSVK